jgi:hypothetical protein
VDSDGCAAPDSQAQLIGSSFVPAANVDSASIMQAAGWSTLRILTRYTARLNAKRGAIARFYKLG